MVLSASADQRRVNCTTPVESGQKPLVKKDCAVIPVIVVGEVEKWRELGKREPEGIIPVIPFSGISNVIPLNTLKTPDNTAIIGGSHKGNVSIYVTSLSR